MTATRTPETRAPGQSTLDALLAVIFVALVLWLVLWLTAAGVVMAMFGGLFGLVLPVLALVGSVAVIATITRQLTGRARVGGAFVVTAMAAASLAVALVQFGTIPMIWVPPGLELVYLLIALACAFASLVFYGPSWLRAVGAAVTVAIIVWWCIALAPTEPESATQPVALDEQFATFETMHDATLVSAVAGSTILSLESFGSPAQYAWMRTADGGVLTIVTDVTGPPESIAHVYECWMIADPNTGLDPTDSVTDYSDWCVVTEDGWQRADGAGYVRVDDGVTIAVSSVEPALLASVGASDLRPATAAEVQAAFGQLRPITDEELTSEFQRTVP